MADQNYAKYAEMDLGRTGAARNNQTQTRVSDNFMASSDLDHMEFHPHEGLGSNPATSGKQARFMRACAHGAKMRSKCPSKKVAREFSHT
jgi:hypothetical protein